MRSAMCILTANLALMTRELGVLLALLIVTAYLLALAPGLAAAQPPGKTREEIRQEIKREDERRPEKQLELRLGPATLILGGEVELETESELNFDLNDDSHEDTVTLTVSTELEANLKFPRYLELFGEVKFNSRHFILDEPGDNEDDTDFEMGENWIFLKDLFKGHLGLKAGRQDFDDVREWVYDEDLDAVRLFLDFENLGVEAAVTEQLVDVRPRDSDVTNYVLYASYEPVKRVFVDAYLLIRDDHSRVAELRDPEDSDPIWLGLRSHGRLVARYGPMAGRVRVKYWLDAAYLTGESVTVSKALIKEPTRDLRAYGVDGGATFTFRKTALEPSITGGFALGSGDSTPNDGVDKQFRQTGFQGNNARFNGVESFRYYGELFDPELSNLQIFTAGVGIKPTKKSSIDLIFHHYRQDELATRIRDSNLDADPNGRDRTLGQEIDLIFGWHLNKRFEIELDVASFFPGGAFDAPANDPATFVKLELELNF